MLEVIDTWSEGTIHRAAIGLILIDPRGEELMLTVDQYESVTFKQPATPYTSDELVAIQEAASAAWNRHMDHLIHMATTV